MAKKEGRILITLGCSVCKSQNYLVGKNRTKQAAAGGAVKKIVLRKYCKKCRKHTEHLEGKKK